jgi:hypothetical protein
VGAHSIPCEKASYDFVGLFTQRGHTIVTRSSMMHLPSRLFLGGMTGSCLLGADVMAFAADAGNSRFQRTVDNLDAILDVGGDIVHCVHEIEEHREAEDPFGGLHSEYWSSSLVPGSLVASVERYQDDEGPHSILDEVTNFHMK